MDASHKHVKIFSQGRVIDESPIDSTDQTSLPQVTSSLRDELRILNCVIARSLPYDYESDFRRRRDDQPPGRPRKNPRSKQDAHILILDQTRAVTTWLEIGGISVLHREPTCC